MVKKEYEGQQGWFEIPVKKSVWTAVNIGDELKVNILKKNLHFLEEYLITNIGWNQIIH